MYFQNNIILSKKYFKKFDFLDFFRFLTFYAIFINVKKCYFFDPPPWGGGDGNVILTVFLGQLLKGGAMLSLKLVIMINNEESVAPPS